MIYNSCNNKNYFDPFFEAIFGKGNGNTGYLPMKTDVYESDKAYRLDVEAPGFSKENFDLDYKEGYLTISVKTEAVEEGEFKMVRRERFSGETSRQFYLGDVDEKGITASYKDGILSVVAPKIQPEEQKPHKIQVQ